MCAYACACACASACASTFCCVKVWGARGCSVMQLGISKEHSAHNCACSNSTRLCTPQLPAGWLDDLLLLFDFARHVGSKPTRCSPLAALLLWTVQHPGASQSAAVGTHLSPSGPHDTTESVDGSSTRSQLQTGMISGCGTHAHGRCAASDKRRSCHRQWLLTSL